VIGAVSEAFLVHLADHGEGAFLALGLALRKVAEVRDFCCGKEHGGAVRAGGDAGTATDAGCGVECVVGVVFADRDGVRVDRGASADVDVSASGDDTVEGRAVDDEVLDDGERIGTEWLDPKCVAVAEFPHVDLACGDALFLGVWDAVDGKRAGTADALAAVVIEMYGIVALLDDAFVDDVEHFEKRSLRWNIFRRISVNATFRARSGLAPYF